MSASTRVAVLGAGITGLTAAWHLKRAGADVVVFEAAARVGGVVGEHREGEWLHELGPNTLLEGSTEVASFIDDVGLGSRRLYAAETAKNRYIVRRGRPAAVPTSPLGLFRTPLFSGRAKLGLAGECFRPRGDPNREESVADFVVRRLGREFLDYAVDPFVSGVYAGDPSRLSLRHAFPKIYELEREHGSLFRGAMARRGRRGGPRRRIFSFPQGLGELPRAIAQSLGESVRLRSVVRGVRRLPAQWEIEYEREGTPQRVEFDAVLCALPADATAAVRFERVAGAGKLRELREIEQPPVASVFTGFRRDEVAHPLDGFGVLVPECERGRILGSLFSSELFPGRAPQGCVALTTFVGGARHPELAQLSDAALVHTVQAELSRLLGVRGAPRYVHLARWPRAIPQYTLGYQRFKDIFGAIEADAPRLFFGGNARDGISLANCIDSGRRLAQAVLG